MNFWKEVVKPDAVPTEEPEKSEYNAARLVGSAIVQEYHVMIQEGLEFSYLTNGLVDVQLWVPLNDPGTLFYDLGEPCLDRTPIGGGLGVPRTRIGRALCLCLMSFRSSYRDQAWRNDARAQLPIWHTSFDSVRAQIPATDLQQHALSVEHAGSEYTSSEQTASEYLPSSSPLRSPVAKGRRMATRSSTGCAPPSDAPPQEDSSDSDADRNTSAGRKRGISQVTSSPPGHQSAAQEDTQENQSGRSRQHVAQFCTQRCLLGLQQGGVIDPLCPNANLHISGRQNDRHPVDAGTLVQMLKEQLDKDLDHNFTPIGLRGSFSAPFKVTSVTYGYTIVGKATTSRRWKEVSREADVYRILQRAQGSAIPVFLGVIDLAGIYFLHGAGDIRHMLLMGWGGEDLSHLMPKKSLRPAIERSLKEINSLGVLHQDLRQENILWNAELNRALIIDFHRCSLVHRPMAGSLKRIRCAPKERKSKRVRVV
jgi:predicted Ser/Thr protein kinase